MLLRRLTALVLTVLATACATHEASPAFRRTVFIDDRGISVPLPPPSLLDVKKQTVDLEGSTQGADSLEAGTKLFVEDKDGDAYRQITLDAGATTFVVHDLDIDLTMNCLEVWMQAPDGRESHRLEVQAHVVDATTIETVEGCE